MGRKLMDVDRLRVDPVYRILWVSRLAIVTFVLAVVLAMVYWAGWMSS